MELDLKDRKILYELDLDSRQSYQSIAKRVGLSKEVVNYRVKRLVDAGVVTSFFARIDAARMGAIGIRTFVRFQDFGPDSRQELIQMLIKHPQCGWVGETFGIWDLNFIFVARNIQDYHQFWQGLMEKYQPYIAQSRVAIFDRYIQYPKTFLLDKSNEDAEFVGGRGEPSPVDETDVAILQVLSADARMPTFEVAERLHLGGAMVAKRIKRLRKSGVIQGFGVSIALDKIGYKYYKMHLTYKRFSRKDYGRLLQYTKNHPNIIYINELVGGDDFEIDAYLPDDEAYATLVADMYRNFPDLIRRIENMQYCSELKHNLLPGEEKKK